MFVWALAVAFAIPNPEDCFGKADYSDELAVDTSSATVQRTPLAGGLVRLEVTGLTLENTGIANFDRAEVTPQLEAHSLTVDRAVPGDFPQIVAGASASALQGVVIDVAAANEATVTAELLAGRVPFQVHAAEAAQLHDTVVHVPWDAALDAAYAEAIDRDPKVNPDPGKGPWTTGTTFPIAFAYDSDSDVPALFTSFQSSGLTLLVADSAGDDPFLPADVPTPLHRLTLTSVVVDLSGPGAWVEVEARLAGEVDPRDVYKSASLCTIDAIDHPVRETRLTEVNDTERELDDVLNRTEPVWFREVSLLGGDVTISGQVHVQALAPVFVVRIREGAAEVEVGLQSAISVSAQLAHDKSIEGFEEQSLGRLCFPLPGRGLGIAGVEHLLCVEPVLYIEAEVNASLTVAMTERLDSSLTLLCRWGPAESPNCEVRDNLIPDIPSTPSPPQIESELTGRAEWGVRVDQLWVMQNLTQPPLIKVEVGVGTQLYGTFLADALNTPNWSLGHGKRLLGRVTMDFMTQSTLDESFPLWDPGPHIDRSASISLASMAGGSGSRFQSGEDLRWVVGIDDLSLTQEQPEDVDVALLSDGGMVLTAVQTGAHRLMALDRYGALTWTQRYASGYEPRGVVTLPDDTVMVAGRPGFLAAHDPSGALEWARRYTVTTSSKQTGVCNVQGMAHMPDAAGGQGRLALVGELGNGVITEAEGCVFVVDAATGDLVWSAAYGARGRQVLHGGVATRNGDLVVVGTTDLDGWMMRLDPNTGEPRFSVVAVTGGARGGELLDVAEGVNGRLLAVGTAGREIRHTGSGYVMAVDADGENMMNGFLFHRQFGQPTSPTEPWVLSSDTAGDRLRQVVAVDNGFLVAGHTTRHGETGWIARISDRLGVDWFTAMSGETETALTAIESRGDAVIVAGTSRSATMLPQLVERSVMAAAVPFDGNLEVHPAFDHLQSPLITAGVVDGFAAEGPGGEPATFAATWTPGKATWSEVTNLLITPSTHCTLLMTETGHGSSVDGCPDQPDLWAPLVQIEQPTASSYDLGTPLPLVVWASDESNTEQLTVTVDGDEVPSDAVLDLSMLGVGDHEVLAVATDDAGNVGTDRVVFRVVDDAVDPTGDTGTEPPDEERDRRCSCTTTPPSGALLWGLLLLMSGLVRRGPTGIR